MFQNLGRFNLQVLLSDILTLSQLEVEIKDPKSDLYKGFHPTNYSPRAKCSTVILKFVLDFAEGA